MVGVLITLLFAFGAMGVGQFLLKRWTQDSDPAEAFGLHGLVGLGVLGLLTLPIGLMPNGLKWGIYLVSALAVAGFVSAGKAAMDGQIRFKRPEGPMLLFPVAVSVAGLFALVGVLAPSDALDWDSLAYHLAVPKLWMQAGQIHYIPYIHQSNFPYTVEDLYVWGMTWGGQSGAKAFTLCFFLFGVITLFGFARSRFGERAAWWSSLAYSTVPVIMWESGTGYIDVPNGIFGGLGIAFAARFIADPARRSSLALSAICLGFAVGTKYTGLQAVASVGLVLLIAFAVRKQAAEGLKSAVLVGLAALAIGGGWYVKTFAMTGNPVFPFFFEHFGGRNWDQRRADIYRKEQQTFGAGTLETRHSLTQVGNAILGLAYQPGRYVNPAEDKGLGTPLGAVGVVVILSGMLWCLSGKRSLFESSVLAVVGISLVMWFFLSEQSRYVVPLCLPLALLAGGGIERLKAGKLLMATLALQAVFSFYLVYSQRFVSQSQVALGKVTPEDYQAQTIGFYDAAQDINKEVGAGKIALYDEVFGYLLDVSYVWANPPHSLLIPYDTLTDGASYAAAMKKLGFTHIYISTSVLVKDPAEVKRWVAAMGLQGPPVPYSEAERKVKMDNWQDMWMVLLAEAVAGGQIQPVKPFKHGILFKIP